VAMPRDTARRRSVSRVSRRPGTTRVDERAIDVEENAAHAQGVAGLERDAVAVRAGERIAKRQGADDLHLARRVPGHLGQDDGPRQPALQANGIAAGSTEAGLGRLDRLARPPSQGFPAPPRVGLIQHQVERARVRIDPQAGQELLARPGQAGERRPLALPRDEASGNCPPPIDPAGARGSDGDPRPDPRGPPSASLKLLQLRRRPGTLDMVWLQAEVTFQVFRGLVSGYREPDG
jgi:hypothetical protein